MPAPVILSVQGPVITIPGPDVDVAVGQIMSRDGGITTNLYRPINSLSDQGLGMLTELAAKDGFLGISLDASVGSSPNNIRVSTLTIVEMDVAADTSDNPIGAFVGLARGVDGYPLDSLRFTDVGYHDEFAIGRLVEWLAAGGTRCKARLSSTLVTSGEIR